MLSITHWHASSTIIDMEKNDTSNHAPKKKQLAIYLGNLLAMSEWKLHVYVMFFKQWFL